jgi:hypothetical protein
VKREKRKVRRVKREVRREMRQGEKIKDKRED